jgi:ribosomal protein S16
MPKKRSPRQRKAAAEQSRQERIAVEAARREEHAKLVAQRHGDTRFSQRVTQPDGTALLTFGTQHREEMRGVIQDQRRAFHERFGREMGPADPFLFDATQEVPTALTEEQIRAWAELGYIITEHNQHLFSASEVDAYLLAVARHQDNEEPLG